MLAALQTAAEARPMEHEGGTRGTARVSGLPDWVPDEPGGAEPWRPALDAMGTATFFEKLSRETLTSAQRVQRLHEWFDAFRTMKFLHWMRDHGLAPLSLLGRTCTGTLSRHARGPLRTWRPGRPRHGRPLGAPASAPGDRGSRRFELVHGTEQAFEKGVGRGVDAGRLGLAGSCDIQLQLASLGRLKPA